MPRLEDLEHLGNDVGKRWRSTWDSFSNFALRDNVLEVAVGVILASAFSALTNSLVTDIIVPIISLLPFISRNLDEKFMVLKGGHRHTAYYTIQQALDDGALVWAYGNFLDKILRFLLIALSLFATAKIYGWASGDAIVKKQVKCKYCRKYISEKAKRCVNCTSWLDGREEKSVDANNL